MREGLRRLGLPAVALLLCGCPRGGSKDPPRAGDSPPRFLDVAEKAGIDYGWPAPTKRPLNILQTIGNGCAFFDYDNDGNLDILLVGRKLALYHGDGSGHFKNVTAETGLDKLTGHFLGCAIGDIDGDGMEDIYLTAYRGGILLRNESSKGTASETSTKSVSSPTYSSTFTTTTTRSSFTTRFRDITAQSGIKPQPWSTSAAFAETVPGSGKLDLFIGDYAVFGPEQIQLCKEHGVFTSCGPRYYKPIPGVLFLNDGHGKFRESTRSCIPGKMSGRVLGAAWSDFMGNGQVGLGLANDEIAGDLLVPGPPAPNSGGAGGSWRMPRFKNMGDVSGTAYDRDGNVHGGMGIDWGDYDNDGKIDLFVATFQGESKSLYRNEGDGRFSDLGIPSGVGSPMAPNVAFGSHFLDFDNDGWLDLIVANGHVQDNIHQIDPTTDYRQATNLLRNKGGSPATFEDLSASSGPDLQRKIVGRGLAVGDYDNDGRVDVLIVDSEGRPLLLHNQATAGHWLGVKLEGRGSCNRDGYGAVLTATINGRKYVRECRSDGSYMSSSDRRVHFGLGSATKVDSLSIRWPSGHVDTLKDLPGDRYMTIRLGGT